VATTLWVLRKLRWIEPGTVASPFPTEYGSDTWTWLRTTGSPGAVVWAKTAAGATESAVNAAMPARARLIFMMLRIRRPHSLWISRGSSDRRPRSNGAVIDQCKDVGSFDRSHWVLTGFRQRIWWRTRSSTGFEPSSELAPSPRKSTKGLTVGLSYQGFKADNMRILALAG
jgi:hypothetical protein